MDNEERLRNIEEKLVVLRRAVHGGTAISLPNNRILTRVIVDYITIHFFVDARDLLITPTFVMQGVWEPSITNYFFKHIKSESHCLDVGANFGYFTCLMAKLAWQGKVIGVEPDPHMHRLVMDNIYSNWFTNTASAICAAVADVPGYLKLYRFITRSGNTGMSSLSQNVILKGGEIPDQFNAECITLDSLLERMNNRIDFIKIDVEGAEPLVIKGARKLIELNPQVNIIIEWSPEQMQSAGQDVPEFCRTLNSLGLQAHTISEYGVTAPISNNELSSLEYQSGVLFNRKA
jgi:FkbM family methyltransferase